MVGRGLMAILPRRGKIRPLHLYMTAVSVAGVGVFVHALVRAIPATPQMTAAFWLLAALILVLQAAPISVQPWVGGVVSTSFPFALAMMLGWSVYPATVAFGLGTVLGAVSLHQPLRKLLFNFGQQVLTIATAGAVYGWLEGGRRFDFTRGQLLSFVLAALAATLVNSLLVRGCLALGGVSPFATMSRLRFEAWASLVELSMGLVVLLIAQQVPWVLLVLALTSIIPIHVAARAALDADARRAEAESARNEAESVRAEAEGARVQAELARSQAEAAQAQAETARAEAEARRAAAEQVASEHARLIDASNRLIQRLEEVDRHKDEMLAAVTHELRTPASSILGVARTLGQAGDRISPEQHQQFLSLILEQAEQLDQLISQLLLAAKLQQPQFVADPTTQELADLAELARRAGQLATLTYPDRTVTVDADEPLPVRVDRKVVAQILGNLVGNAATHTPSGTPIWLQARRRGGLAVVAVEDRGPGVPPQERARVFERFTQLNGTDMAPKGGVGLGLYIARQLARAQSGEVLAVDPVEEGGARFELRLPMLESAPDGRPDGKPAAAATSQAEADAATG
jgi:signal transduction histidine kinase